MEIWDAKCEIVYKHFQLLIPWKVPEEQMPDNFKVAKNIVESLYKSLKGTSLVKTYDKKTVKLKHVLNIRGFNLRKCIASEPTLLKGFEQSDRVATQTTLADTSVLGIRC